MGRRFEAHHVTSDGIRTVWCNSPVQDDVFGFAYIAGQLEDGEIEIVPVEHSEPPLPPFASNQKGNWFRYATIGVNLPPW